MTTLRCLECDAELFISDMAEVGDLITCQECDATFEIVAVDPVEIDFADESDLESDALLITDDDEDGLAGMAAALTADEEWVEEESAPAPDLNDNPDDGLTPSDDNDEDWDDDDDGDGLDDDDNDWDDDDDDWDDDDDDWDDDDWDDDDDDWDDDDWDDDDWDDDDD